MTEIETRNSRETIDLGASIGRKCIPGSVVALEGALGAGKTTFVQGIAQGLGIEEQVTSPTFIIISEYLEGSLPLFHMDLYRIENDDQFIDLGGDEYFESGGVCVIEWSERITPILPESTVSVSISITGPESRIFTFKGIEL